MSARKAGPVRASGGVEKHSRASTGLVEQARASVGSTERAHDGAGASERAHASAGSAEPARDDAGSVQHATADIGSTPRASAYGDVYLRQVLKQIGAGHQGGALSPDILPWGVGTAPDPSALGVPPAWDQDDGVALVPGTCNHVYVRAFNPSAAAVGTRLLLASAAPALPCWPDRLTPVPTGKGKPYAELLILPQQAGVPAEGFAFSPDDAAVGLVAWGFTAAHPVVPPVLADVVELSAFLVATPSYVQRSAGFGLQQDAYRYEARYEQRARAARMIVEIAWRDAPVGWTVSLLPASGSGVIHIAPTKVFSPLSAIQVPVDVPAGYDERLVWTIQGNGIAALPSTRFELRLSLQLDAGGARGHGAEAPAQIRLGGHTWCAQPPRQGH